jgi:hypothetical protein
MQAIENLKAVVAKAPSLLLAISPAEVSKPVASGKWSKKQELGHLIDSACNNHQRIVRAQLEEQPSLAGYDGDGWVALHSYQTTDWREMIDCWRVMNQQLIRAASSISPQTSRRKLKLADNLITIDFLSNDYLEHLVHHLEHIGIDLRDRAPLRTSTSS